MGTVYEAWDSELTRVVALKMPRPELLSDPTVLQRFMTEARSAAGIRHPNVCPIYDVGQIDGQYFLTMPLIDGVSLAAWLEKHVTNSAEAAQIIRKLSSALQAVHDLGTRHRDIKASNVMIDRRGEPILMDFGLARLNETATHVTDTGSMLGTPAYMAPEQIEGGAAAGDHRADIYSLGVLFYQLLTGRLPFVGPVTRVLVQIATQDPPSLESFRPDVDPNLAAICLKAMSRDPAARYQTAAELESALVGQAFQPDPNAPQNIVSESRQPDPITSQNLESKPSQPDAIASPDVARPSGQPGKADLLGAPVAIPQQSGSATSLPTTADWPIRRRAMPKPRVAITVGGVLLLLAAVVYRIVTNEGTLVVTIEDPGVQAILEQGGLEIRDKHSDRFWTVKAAEKKPLPSGEYRLVVSQQLLVTDDSGAELKTDTFTLKRKGEVRVRVTLEQNARLAGKNGGANKAAVGTGWHGWSADAPPPAIAPLDAEQAKQHQEAWAKYLKIDMEYTNSIGMKFCLIPPGEFTMGSTPAEIEEALKFVVANDKRWQECIKSEAPQHKVIVMQPIYLGVHEVTQADYEKVMGKNPSWFATAGPDKASAEKVVGMDTTSHPVEGVSWNDAADFCVKLSQQENLMPFYFRAGETVTPLDGTGYRLPSEAEWELACRAGTTTQYWIGDKDEELLRAGWITTNSGGRTHAVGEFKGNPFGLYDIHGNVWEWVQDRWVPTYYGQFPKIAAINPVGPFGTGSKRVIRGGGWDLIASSCRASRRYADVPTCRYGAVGFRVSLVAVGPRVAGKDTETSTAADPDRHAAEYVLSIGGNIKIKDNGQERPIAAVGDLPRKAFELTGVVLDSNPKVSDAGLAHFSEYKKLTALQLGTTRVSDAGLLDLASLPSLEGLSLANTRISLHGYE